MRRYPEYKEEPTLESKQESWIRGLDTLVSATQIRPDELAEAEDIMLVEDGKVQCPRDGQAYFGNSSGDRVTGLFNFYKSDGTKSLLRTVGTALQKYNSSTGDFDDVSGFTYTTGLNTNAITAYDSLYICNGTDKLTKYDGSSITSYTEISAPDAPTVARTAGSAGTYTFSYKITAVTAVGETTASTAGTQTLSVGTLDTDNYLTVSWSAVTDATGYNVYGRTDGNWKFIVYLEGNGSVSYIDKGAVTPQDSFPPPEGNTTGGPVGKYIDVYKDSLFILGDPNNPSRLYYSGGGDHITDFTIAGGGGFIDISKNDGQVGTGLKLFKNSMLVFKEDSVYQFSFTTDGLPSVTQVTSAVGCIAPRSIIAVENDIFFAARRGIFTIGNESGFAFDVLRTNELSARVRPIYMTIDQAYIQNISAIYATAQDANLVIFAYTPSGGTTNSKAIVFDRERTGWYRWNGINANCFVTYRSTTGVARFLYGDDTSGYVCEILTGSQDFGTAIHGHFKLKAENFKSGARYKTLKDIDIILRNPTGSVLMNVIKEGVTTAHTANITTISPSINMGHYVMAEFLLGESYGTGVSAQDDNLLKTFKNVNIGGRAFQLEFDNNSNASFTLLYAGMRAKQKSVGYRESGDIVS